LGREELGRLFASFETRPGFAAPLLRMRLLSQCHQ
jgi:hypothetical protein